MPRHKHRSTTRACTQPGEDRHLSKTRKHKSSIAQQCLPQENNEVLQNTLHELDVFHKSQSTKY
jgi:hypothetical protein